MDKRIERSVQERMRSLCRRISVAHDLDPEIQEELYGHMEDKLLAYLAGEEKLSDEDAFILVREHFGDPAVLKGLLHEVHDYSVRASLARRLAAALVTTVALKMASDVLIQISLKGFGWVGIWMPLAFHLMSLATLCYMLVRWQRRLERGRQPWFVRWPARRVAAVVVVAAVLPLLNAGMDTRLFRSAEELMGLGRVGLTSVIVLLYALPVLEAGAWLWWSDRPPRAARGLGWASLLWIALYTHISFFPKIAAVVAVGMGVSTVHGVEIVPFAQGAARGSHSGALVPMLAQAFAFNVAAVACLALAAWILYRTGRFVHARITKRSVRPVIA